MKKFFIVSIILICAFFFSIASNFSGSRTFIANKINQETKNAGKRIVLGNKAFNDINYYRGLAYNQKRFPETQFEKLNLKITNLNSPNLQISTIYNQKMKNKSKFSRFFIEPINDKVLIIYAKGTFAYLNDKLEKKIFSNYSSELSGAQIMGSMIHEQNLFISYKWSENKKTNSLINNDLKKSKQKDKAQNCYYLKIAKASLKKKELLFEEIYKTNDCKDRISGGKMSVLKSSLGILLSTDAQFEFKNLAQDPKSSFGKIMLINLEDYKYKVFSSGHRNPMGLFVQDNLILETEHGPCGGDEINLIKKDKNYGWPKMSMGDDYIFCKDFDNRKKYSHSKNNTDKSKFIDPIYSFVPSIGISSIIKIPNTFSPYWQDNYFVASLNGQSLYRIKFDLNFKKILFIEKIFIGDRIIDIKFDEKNNHFLLALELRGRLGELSVQ